MKVLVVEDNVEFYEGYLLRIFSRLLPEDKVEITHAESIEAAAPLLALPWDAILMDHGFSDSVRVPPDGPEGSPVLRDGVALVKHRRALEAQTGLPAAFIIGIASNQVGNRLMVEAGANTALLKLHVPEMAREITQRIPA